MSALACASLGSLGASAVDARRMKIYVSAILASAILVYVVTHAKIPIISERTGLAEALAYGLFIAAPLLYFAATNAQNRTLLTALAFAGLMGAVLAVVPIVKGTALSRMSGVLRGLSLMLYMAIVYKLQAKTTVAILVSFALECAVVDAFVMYAVRTEKPDQTALEAANALLQAATPDFSGFAPAAPPPPAAPVACAPMCKPPNAPDNTSPEQACYNHNHELKKLHAFMRANTAGGLPATAGLDADQRACVAAHAQAERCYWCDNGAGCVTAPMTGAACAYSQQDANNQLTFVRNESDRQVKDGLGVLSPTEQLQEFQDRQI